MRYPDSRVTLTRRILEMDRPVGQDLEWARWAVEQWVGFPIDRASRPLVLVGPAIRVDGGFRNDPAKRASDSGAVDGDESVPPEVLDTLRRPQFSVADHLRGAPIYVKHTWTDECDFQTDRGNSSLAAWRVESETPSGGYGCPIRSSPHAGGYHRSHHYDLRRSITRHTAHRARGSRPMATQSPSSSSGRPPICSTTGWPRSQRRRRLSRSCR